MSVLTRAARVFFHLEISTTAIARFSTNEH